MHKIVLKDVALGERLARGRAKYPLVNDARIIPPSARMALQKDARTTKKEGKKKKTIQRAKRNEALSHECCALKARLHWCHRVYVVAT